MRDPIIHSVGQNRQMLGERVSGHPRRDKSGRRVIDHGGPPAALPVNQSTVSRARQAGDAADPYRETHEVFGEFARKLGDLSSELLAKRITQDQYDEAKRQLRREYDQKMDAALAIADRRLDISPLH